MVSCRSCGRNITSGTIRCSRCSTAFHLSCSHRYRISPDGVFNVCCGNSEPPRFGGYQMRTCKNKRRQPGIAANFNFRPENQNNAASTPPPPLIYRDNMRYGKVQKLEMGICDIPTNSNEDNNSCSEIILESSISQEENNITENSTSVINTNDEDDDDILEITEIRRDETVNIDDDEVTNQNQKNSDQQVFNITNELNNKITLETVWQGISSLQSSISNISNSLDTVSTHLNTFDPRINELEATLKTIKEKSANFENVQNDVSGLRTELENIRTELNNIQSKQPEKEMNISEVFIEIKERDMKSRNIIIYNVPEDNLRISQDYSTLDDINKFNELVAARDCSRAREILSDIPNIELEDIQVRRLGRANPNTCRPLRVTLQCKEDVIEIMRNRRLVSNPYNVKTDLTKFQQKKIRKLREELDGINKDKRIMTIRFISGEPQIVPIHRNFMKRE